MTGLRCCIPEHKVDLKHLIDLLIDDKRKNPSNYSLVILSEDAEWQGYTVREYGEADAFGHRKKMSVAEDLSGEIKRAVGEESVVSDLTYDLRWAVRTSSIASWHLRLQGWPWMRWKKASPA